ncbi:MAG: hypothetical protein L0Z50_18275 [Verrucomicrobiales bacterium]|nr:hypothetical protein [Verrucomicrobiales bacterium]
MNKLNKEKRDKLGLIGVGTALVTMLFYFFVVSPQREQIALHEDKIERSHELLNKDERWIRQGPLVRENLATYRQTLETRQTDMAPLDKFKWFYNTLESFQSRYDVSLVDITREPEFGEVGVLPNFAYQAAIFGVKLNATYHDFGKFLADFENKFPYMRVQNLRLELDPAQKLAGTNALIAASLDTRERLAITLKVVTLVKPTTPL